MTHSHAPSSTVTPAALTDYDAAKYAGVSVGYLRAARLGRCIGPTYIRIGRAVRYLTADLDAFLTERRVGSCPADSGTLADRQIA